MKLLVLSMILIFTVTGCTDDGLSEADQKRLENYLKSVDAKILLLQIDTPEGDNAITALRKAKALSPNYGPVLERAQQIAEFYETDARDLLDKNEAEKALVQVKKGLEIAPGSASLASLEKQVESLLATRQRIDDGPSASDTLAGQPAETKQKAADATKDRSFLRDYMKAVKLLESNDIAGARDLFSSAAIIDDQEQARRKIYGMVFEPYIPLFYLGKIEYLDGNCENALGLWKASLAQGVIQQLDEHQYILDASQDCKSSDKEDTAAIEQAVQNYVSAVYDMKPELLDSSVSPRLSKVGYMPAEDGSGLAESWMTFNDLKELAGHINKDGMFDPDSSPRKVTVLEVNDLIATVKLEAAWGIDYIHLTKFSGEWMIMNVIWQWGSP